MATRSADRMGAIEEMDGSSRTATSGSGRQMANREREDPDGEVVEEIRGPLRKPARMRAKKERELGAGEWARFGS